MDKTEEIKKYIEYLLERYIQFYELSKATKSFKYDIMGEIDKISNSMNIILNSIEFETPTNFDLKEYVRDFKLKKILNDEQN